MKKLDQIEKHNNFCDKYNLIDYFIYRENKKYYQLNNYYERVYFNEYSAAPATIEDLKELFNIKDSSF